MKLVIVESPTKAKTISGFLGSDFSVISSYGHVRDLPKSKLGIDVKNDFEPQYTIPKKAKEHVAQLQSQAAKADMVILASDEDREGEAIAWHIASILKEEKQTKKRQKGTNAKPMERIVFHEITPSAIKEALLHPRQIDMRLVDAQQARRVLDRLVGYELSPFLWRKIRYGLSAGRVQSVAVRLVVEREREIQKFVPQEYWSIEATFSKKGDEKKFVATLISYQGSPLEKMSVTNTKQAHTMVDELQKESWHISRVTKKEASRYPAPPFTTSTLQQEASRKLGFSAKQTMVIAQQLYEQGFITYMRTDSTNLATSATTQARDVIYTMFGESYVLAAPRIYAHKSKGAQEAHEAIRPTNFSMSTQVLGLKDKGQQRLYDLIWKRAIASQMKEARIEQTSADIASQNQQHIFRATGSVILFDGFMHAYGKNGSESDEAENRDTLPTLTENEELRARTIDPYQHFTEPPARYTDATLVKALETYGIGRPSTYAPTLSTIQERGYVEKIEKKYIPTETGTVVNDMLVKHFPEIVDINFTSHVEEELDEIAQGTTTWTKVCKEFYGPFKKHLTEKEESVEKHVEISSTLCPHCQKPMLIKFGRMGKFLACPDPENKFTLPLPEEAEKIKELQEKTKDERCPLCDSPMAVKRGRFGFFLGCTRYPECKGIAKIWNKIGFLCPLCRETRERKEKPGDLVERKGRGRAKPFYGCTRYPECAFILNARPSSEKELQALYEEWRKRQTEGKKEKTIAKKQTRGTKKHDR